MMMFKSCTKQCLSISTDGSESCMDDTGKFSYSLRSKAHLCRPKLELPPLEDPSYIEPVLNTVKASNAAEPLYDEVLYYPEEPIYVEGPIYAEAIELSTSSAEEHAEENADERETSMKDTSVYIANNNHCIFKKKRTFKKKCHRLYSSKRYSFSSTTNTEESTMDTDEIVNKNMEDMDYDLFHWYMYLTRCSTPLYSQVLNPSSASITSTVEIISEEDGNVDENKNDIASMQKATFKSQVDQACVYKDNNMMRPISYWLPKRKPIKLLCGGHVEQMIKKYTIANSNCRNEEKLSVGVNNVCQKTGYVKDMVKHYLENIKKHEIEISSTNYNKNLKAKAI